MRKSQYNIPWYVADFETTGLKYYNEHGCTKVWLYSIADSEAKIVEDGSDIGTFMAWCESHCGSIVYFHNLKFDGSFILNWLYENGYQYFDRLLSHSKKGYTTLVGDMGEFYQLKINFASNKQIIIIDSLKIIPLKVSEIAKAFDLPIEKEHIDYNDYTIDDKRLEYVHHDVQIVAMALKYFKDKGLNKMTIGSNSYHKYMDSIPYTKELFPMLDEEWLKEWRKAYRGGRSQVNPLFQDTILHNVRRYDLNSMYPYVMSRCPMPYGEPILIKEPKKYAFELYHVHILFRLKEGHLPTLLKKNGLFSKGDTYYLETEGIEDMYISNIDLDLVYEHYDVAFVEYLEIYGFETTDVLFREFVDYYYALKRKSVGGMRLLYKLLLNNLYGKFGSKPTGRNKIPCFDEEGLSWKYSEEHAMGKYYLPVAIAVTSYAHKVLDDAIMMTGYNNFVYCDTDSIHTIGTLPSNMIDAHELGKFKLEATESISKYIRQKCYIYKENGSWGIVCAGMSESLKDYLVRQYGDDVINVFKIGLVLDENSEGMQEEDMKLLPKQVKGGMLLMPTRFSLN